MTIPASGPRWGGPGSGMPESPNQIPARPATTTSSATTESAAAMRSTAGTPSISKAACPRPSGATGLRQGSHPAPAVPFSATGPEGGHRSDGHPDPRLRAYPRCRSQPCPDRPAPGKCHGDHLIMAEELAVDHEGRRLLVGNQIHHLGTDHHLHRPLVLGGEIPDGGLHHPVAGHTGEEVGVTQKRGNPGLGRAKVDIGRRAAWTTRPDLITATVSLIASASSWSWVTKTDVVRPRPGSSAPHAAPGRAGKRRGWRTARRAGSPPGAGPVPWPERPVVVARRTTRGGGAPPNRRARPTRDLADPLAPLTPGVESVGDIGGCGHMGEQGVVLEHHPHPAPLRRHVDTRVPRPCVHRRRPSRHRAVRIRRSPAAPWSCHIRMGRADRGGRPARRRSRNRRAPVCRRTV